LAKNRNEKGDLFEEFMQKVLDSAGYEDFKRGIRKTGRQIDLYAKHKVTGHPIICECKAHEESIGAEDIHKFYGIYDKEYRQNDKLVGLFFSLSGFNSTALATYEEMPSHVKERFLLLDGDFILSMLRKTKVIASDDKLEHIITSNIKYSLGERYLVYIKTGIYWMQLVLAGNQTTHYLVLVLRAKKSLHTSALKLARWIQN
jgi:restriction endonuclease Mrr